MSRLQQRGLRVECVYLYVVKVVTKCCLKRKSKFNQMLLIDINLFDVCASFKRKELLKVLIHSHVQTFFQDLDQIIRVQTKNAVQRRSFSFSGTVRQCCNTLHLTFICW